MKMKFQVLIFLFCFSSIQAQVHPVFNRAPLRDNPYTPLPIGEIRPQGWLKEMLVRQKDGATGQLDKLYPLVMGDRNGWLGGDGDQWERGPYWIDGLLPLAYILQDKALIAKVKPWVEWTIKSQQQDGYFGPAKDYSPEPGIQRDNSHDWWPKIVMLKVLQQYYMATGDTRVVQLMTSYFRYQLKELPAHPLDHWSFWARYRAGDNLMAVYWLYNITGDKFLLELADVLHAQTFDFTTAFLNTHLLSEPGSIHGVNLAQGMKEPIIYYQQHPEQKYWDATVKGYTDLRRFDETVMGLYGGDEALHGNNPTQGSELCTAVEMMYTLESTLPVTGDVSYADRLERIAFNALPTQIAPNFIDRQYFQQANQVMITRHPRGFDTDHSGTDLCFGLLTGYACCTSNMHQGWPKFTQNLWYAAAGNGLAALVFAPSEVETTINGKKVGFTEKTNYPFEDQITFTYNGSNLNFPLSLRIPAWCKQAKVLINGKIAQEPAGNQVIKLDRAWKNGDEVVLQLPMHIFNQRWYENSVSVERGPLAYALKIGEEKKLVSNKADAIEYGSSYYEYRPTTPWNYALIESELSAQYTVDRSSTVAAYPWEPDKAPITIKTKARLIPSWLMYNEMTGPIPYSTVWGKVTGPVTEVELIPYGCTRLRIAQFPVVNR